MVSDVGMMTRPMTTKDLPRRCGMQSTLLPMRKTTLSIIKRQHQTSSKIRVY